MSVTTVNLLQGPFTVYAGAFGALEPATPITAVDPLVWTDCGATTGGLELSVKLDLADLDADQIVDSAGGAIQGRETTAKTTLAEVTLDNIARVLNEVVPAAATSGARSFEPTSDATVFNLNYGALLFVGRAPGGFRRNVILRRALSSDGTKMTAAKDKQSGFDVTWKAYYVSASIKPFKVLDATA